MRGADGCGWTAANRVGAGASAACGCDAFRSARELADSMAAGVNGTMASVTTTVTSSRGSRGSSLGQLRFDF